MSVAEEGKVGIPIDRAIVSFREEETKGTKPGRAREFFPLVPASLALSRSFSSFFHSSFSHARTLRVPPASFASFCQLLPAAFLRFRRASRVHPRSSDAGPLLVLD